MVKWLGDVPKLDDFRQPITDTFIDGKTVHGPWAMMSPSSWERHGVWKLGTGFGQMYKKIDGEWIKVKD